jgi:hypothetical protein
MPTTSIGGRAVVDRAGVAELTGAALITVDSWYARRAQTGFPERADDRWWYTDEVTDWWHAHQASKRDKLTPVDRSGDPDELITVPEAARVLGYLDRRSLSNSSVWTPLLAHVDDEGLLPSGRVRRRWRRDTVWRIADARRGAAGRPRGRLTHNRPLDRGGDPDELVGTTEAARVLGYPRADKLPAGLLQAADEVTTGPGGRHRRRWQRRTLWNYATGTQDRAEES